MSDAASKLTTAEDAISRFVPDGAVLCTANFLHPVCYSLVHELIRQRRRDLTLWSQSSIEEIEQLLLGGCLRRAITAYSYRTGGENSPSQLELKLKSGEVELEDYSNYTLLMSLKAGAMNVPFLPVLPAIRHTDLFRKRTFLGDRKFGIVKDPFNGREVVVVPAVQPDVCIMHVQRADRYGNAQYWGPGANVKWAALASRKIVVSAEEIVDHEVILASPYLTVVPSFRANAVVHEPWGGHPGELLGCYSSDMSFRSLFYMQNNSPDTARAWMDEWVYGVRNRSEYLQHYVDRFGQEPFRWFKAKSTVTAPADYGSAFDMPWNEAGYSERFQMTKAEFEQLLEEKGELVEL